MGISTGERAFPESDQRWQWEAWRARCLREASRYALCEADAEDAVQEALTRAWRKRERCREPERALAWLLQITRNEALRLRGRDADEARRRSRLEQLGQPASEQETHELSAITRVDLIRALANLSAHDRTLVFLRYAADLTQGLSAEVLGVPEGTAKFQLHRSRTRLREWLTADDHEDEQTTV